MGSAQNFVWQSVGFWEICGIFKLEFQCPDKKIWTRFYAKIEFAVYIIYKHISAFYNKYNTYPASFNFYCLQYAWPALQLFKNFFFSVTTRYI